ncbi:hypothetical protein H6CHR_04849 [Variovorax sp. PBL-H6]|uniref:hypothetical protein n=1 Tax=Variovorax sp. PBL-H6 TaxID=434009 RepID=UPI0013188C7A|nr:hypothetical protein [Variovorax sp. PBL-H6]VTU37002.1 hypothetical protein H6CHR_04849 [Variovorax sp. PBL-H6]
MDSPAAVHKSYQRFFAWTFVLATALALSLVWVELAISPLEAPPPMTARPTASGLDLRDLQLLLTVAALIAAFVSLAGLIVTTPLAWLDRRKARARAALELAFKRQDHINWLAAEHADCWLVPDRRPPPMHWHRHRPPVPRIHGNAH